MSASYSLLGSSLSGTFGGNGNQFNDNPGLNTLFNNGGPTLTMLPQTGSLAIDHGSIALAVDANSQTLRFDQRGSGYARITGSAVDIGAVEFGSGAAVGPPGGPSIPVPTLSTWAAALLASLLGLGAWLTGRRRRESESKAG